jgi:hypothetical protein
MVNEPQKGDGIDMEKLRKLVGLTASVKIDVGESAKFLSETKISIGLVGDTSSGKSSLTNALLRTVAMPVAGMACTAYPVRVRKVAKRDQMHKYKLVLPSLADLQKYKMSPIRKAINYFAGDNRIVETDDIKEVYDKLFRDFRTVLAPSNPMGTSNPGTSNPMETSKPMYDVFANLTVAEDDPLGLVIVDTPGPIGGFEKWVQALATLDGSSNPLVIFPISCGKRELCDGSLGALSDAKRAGKLAGLRIIVAFTFIDKPFSCKEMSFEQLLLMAIKNIKDSLGDSVIHFALIQCVDQEFALTNFSGHRLTEKRTLESLPKGILDYPGLIKGVNELEEVLVRLYLKNWNTSGLRKLQEGVEHDIVVKKEALAKMTKAVSTQEIVLKLVERVKLADQQAGHTDSIYSREILRHTHEFLKDLEMEPVMNITYLNAVFGSTNVQLEFQNEKKMRESIQTVLQKLGGCISEVMSEMFKQYENYVSCQTSTCPDVCRPLHQKVLDLLKEFAIGTQKQPGVIAKATEEAQLWFKRAQSGTQLCAGTKGNYKLQLPDKWTTKKDSLAQRMLEELGFTMGQLHWIVCMVFFCEVCNAFPGWLNVRLTTFPGTWSAASQEEIAVVQEELVSLAKTRTTLDEIMELLG